jgi:eukaryotic-like serine/threonine-protein kinase
MVSPASNQPERRTRRARFESGDSIDRRYRVVTSWGAGRLDEAYQVEDLERGGHVILRVLRRSRSPIRPSRSLTRLFARLARIDHPNVARFHDLSVHVVPESGRRDESVLFVTSDLVQGETLGSYVRKERPLPPDVARALIDGICSGLAAAHRKGVIHGSLSSAEITLCSDGGALRPVITDFGLSVGDEKLGGASLGSPVYKAPETLVGRPPDRMSDVFSLGAIIYEILSGRIPFTGGNLLAIGFRRLEEEPRPLGELVENLDPEIGKVVSRCLSRDPDDRYADAGEVREALLGAELTTPRTRRNVSTLSAAAALVVVMFGGSALLDRMSDTAYLLPTIEMVAYRPSFAVLDVAPVGTDTEPWIAVALSHLIRHDFAEDGSLRVAENVLVREYAGVRVPRMGMPDAALTGSLRALFDVESIVVGTCSTDRTGAVPAVALDLCVVDARSGEMIAAAFERGSPESLPELAARAVARLRISVGLAAVESSSIHWDPDAVRPWAEGLLLLREHRPREAVRRLEETMAIQPGDPQVHDALAQAWAEIGAIRRATDSARRAFELSRPGAPEQLLLRRVKLAILEGDSSGAVEATSRLATALPDQSSHSYYLIETLLLAGATKGAAEEIRKLRAARATVDPRTEIMDARLSLQLGRLDDALAHAERGALIAEAAGSAALQGEALTEAARVEALRGDSAAAWATLARAQKVLETDGNLSALARLDSMRAGLLHRGGELDAALEAWARLAERHLTMGREQAYATALGAQATIRSLQGRHSDALRLLDEAVTRFEDLDDDQNQLQSLGVAGSSLLALGRLDEAEANFEAAAGIAHRRDLSAWEGFAHAGHARVALERLDLDDAERNIERAQRIFDSLSLPEEPVGLVIARSELDRLRGNPGVALDRLRRATSRSPVLDPEHLAELELTLASHSRWAGDDAGALTWAEMALEHYEATGNLDRQVDCLTTACAAAETMGNPALTKAIVGKLDRLASRLESTPRLLRARLARAVSLDPSTARSERLAVHSRARALGLDLLALEAALSLEHHAADAGERHRWRAELSAAARRSGARWFLVER